MNGFNKVILIGNVGKQPEIRYVDRRPLAEFTLATNEPAYTNPQGKTFGERTEWHSIVMLDDHALAAEKYITTGTSLMVEGKLRTRTTTDRAGITHRKTVVYVDTFDILSRPAANK